MEKKINTIILAAGKFDARNISVGMIRDVGLQPIRGKSAIAWVLDSAVKNGARDVKVVLRKSSTRLSEFLSYRYPEVEQVILGERGDTIGASTVAILGLCDEGSPTQFILGDTLIDEDFPEEEDVILSSPQVRMARNRCLILKDAQGHVREVYNKDKGVSLEGKEVPVGYYKLSDTRLLKRLAMAQFSRGDFDFFRMLMLYNKERPILIKTTQHWYDLGTISGAVQARLGLFSTRKFNNLLVDAVRGTITKTSTRKQKLLDEANWYRSLPDELAVYAPRVFRVEEKEDSVSVEMEMYGYPNLAESFLFGSGSFEDWHRIISALMDVHARLEQYTQPSDVEELREIYVSKTHKRLAEIPACAPKVYAMMQGDGMVINGRHYRNFPLLREKLESAINGLLSYDRRTIVHGDYCFSNILFDSMHYIFKLIDPRGRFMEQTIYGDPRYDIAKLRHSIVGRYDFITAGLYRLRETSNGAYEFYVSAPPSAAKLQEVFDEMSQAAGYCLSDVKLIEALIFLTMIPLHRDDESRQQAFYLTAIQKLNDILS